jgi:hypothetical protein
MMDPPWAKAALNDLETTSFSQNHVRNRNSDIFEDKVSMSVGCIIVSEHFQISLQFDAWQVGRDQNDRLLFVRVGMVG